MPLITLTDEAGKELASLLKELHTAFDAYVITSPDGITWEDRKDFNTHALRRIQALRLALFEEE